MGYLKYLKKTFLAEEPSAKRDRLVKLRREPNTLRVAKPTRLDRARALGYRAKPGIIVVRQRVARGQHRRPDIKGGRRPKRAHQRRDLSKSYQQIAEEKASRIFPNCEVLGSYLLAQDGKHSWYELVMIDRRHPQVLHDPQLIGIAAQRGRAYRGVTSAGRRSRGLHKKGTGTEKNRPSLRAHKRLH